MPGTGPGMRQGVSTGRPTSAHYGLLAQDRDVNTLAWKRVLGDTGHRR